MTIAMADDHPIIRHGLKAILEAEPEFQLVGEAADGLEATQLAERTKPDVLIVDLMMPGLGGLEVIRQVSQRSPSTRVLALSIHSSEAYVLQALRNGAAGYVLKNSTAHELVHAIREVADGRRFLSDPLSQRAIDAYVQKAQAATVESYDTLTDREREVLHLAAHGCSNTVISARLSISPRTAETHRTHLMRKLGLRGQTELIRYALRQGIIMAED
jgi:two-component system, NarL family, response regulator NreC